MNFSTILRKTDLPVGRASNWIGVITFFVAISGALSWPTSTIEFISKFGWGAILISSILLNCLIIIAISAFLLAYRKFRPLKENERTAKENLTLTREFARSSEQGILDQETQKLLEIKISEMEKTTLKKLEEVGNTLKYLEVMIVNSQEKITELREDVRGAFSAQRTHKIYEDLTSDIDKLIAELSDPADKKEEFPNWQTWFFHYDRFKTQLGYMTRLVEVYIDIRQTIFHVPPEKFKSQYWKFNETGLSDDQKHDYKTFRIIAANYKDAKSKINSSLIDAIYRNP